MFDEFFVSEVEGLPKLGSNRARKGDADFGAPVQSKQDNIDKRVGKERKKTRTARKREERESRAKAGWDEGRVKRGKGAEGGQFVAKEGGGGAEEEGAVQRALGVQDRANLAASIRSFQRKHGLQVDGVVGRQTALALSGRYREARATAVGKMDGQTAALLRQRHQPKRSKRRRVQEVASDPGPFRPG